MKRQFAPLLIAPLLAAALTAPALTQEIPGGTSQNQNGSVDCTDPLQAESAACTGQIQTQQGNNPFGSGNIPSQPNQINQTNPLGAGLQNQSQQTPVYTDNELLARQYAERGGRLPQSLPPEPLTEFQKFVASTTGEVLPIYGADLFRQVPSTFAPLDMAPVPPDYTIGPGDELRVRIWGQVNQRADVRVDRAGDIYLPEVGRVHVAGIADAALDEHLRAAVGRIFRNFDLSAEVGQIRAIQVYVAGQARWPGVYTVSSLSTLVDALFASGGPSTAGSLRHIELHRGGATVTDFDLYALLLHGDKSKDAPLQSGDVIFIPPVGAQVAITGSVKHPALYEVREDEPLSDALSNAGGVTAVAAQARILIERIDEHRDRYAMEVAWDAAGLKSSLADGDLIQVLSILPKYEKTVILRGNVANQGRFAWHDGMRLSDVIPDKESLVTRNYWWKRSQLGLPSQEFEPLQNFPGLRQPNTPEELPRNRLTGQQTINPYTGQPYNNQQTPNDLTAEPFYNNQNQADQYSGNYGNYGNYGNAGNAGLSGYAGVPQQNTLQNNANPNGQMFAGSSQLPAYQRAGNSSLASQQTGLANQNMSSPRTEVGPLAPEIDWDYAVIERRDPDTLKTNLVTFDLGRLVLQHDGSQDLALQPGDVVTIFSQDDIRVPIAQQTKFVRLEGEFVHSGVYTVNPGETLRDLVRRAGGLTQSAYLYGSEFTRLSTRAVQQNRMNEYVQTMEMEMQRGNLALASSPVSSAQDLASGASAQASEQQLVAQLRQMHATGRIVLELNSVSNGVDALPNIALENGDHFIVPPLPASVNVVGAVFDQNSFLYQPQRRAGDYLRMAGGMTRDADRGQAFVIRADGSVISRASLNGAWGNEFDRLRMNPGDTIVVPEKSFRPNALRGFLDWSQLFSQFALGAAALSVIQ
jgi:protein involved in polysaccharide export with SLBB domain